LRNRIALDFNPKTSTRRTTSMLQSTNQLVATAKRFAAPAAIAGAFALGAVVFAGHGNVHAASAIDDNSVSPRSISPWRQSHRE
jgi:hypothetical protein